MTIRRNIDISQFSRDLNAIQNAIEATGAFTRAAQIVEFIGEQCDAFLTEANTLSIGTCNCDGIREIEALMFNMVWRNATCGDSITLGRAMRVGYALEDFPACADTILSAIRNYGDEGADTLNLTTFSAEQSAFEEVAQ